MLVPNRFPIFIPFLSSHVAQPPDMLLSSRQAQLNSCWERNSPYRPLWSRCQSMALMQSSRCRPQDSPRYLCLLHQGQLTTSRCYLCTMQTTSLAVQPRIRNKRSNKPALPDSFRHLYSLASAFHVSIFTLKLGCKWHLDIFHMTRTWVLGFGGDIQCQITGSQTLAILWHPAQVLRA